MEYPAIVGRQNRFWLFALSVATVVNSALVFLVLSRLGQLVTSKEASMSGRSPQVPRRDTSISLSHSIWTRIDDANITGFEAKAVLFTADYCGYCPQVISALGDFSNRLKFVIVDHVSSQDHGDRLRYFEHELGEVVYLEDPDKQLRDDCGVLGYPTMLVMDGARSMEASLVGADEIIKWLAHGFNESVHPM